MTKSHNQEAAATIDHDTQVQSASRTQTARIEQLACNICIVRMAFGSENMPAGTMSPAVQAHVAARPHAEQRQERRRSSRCFARLQVGNEFAKDTHMFMPLPAGQLSPIAEPGLPSMGQRDGAAMPAFLGVVTAACLAAGPDMVTKQSRAQARPTDAAHGRAQHSASMLPAAYGVPSWANLDCDLSRR